MSETRRIRLDVQYVGTDFAGWQIQPALRTAQGVLEEALAAVAGEPLRAYGAGRTDAGVHARGQVAHFDTASRIGAREWARALNRALPWDLRVSAASEVAAGFHARRSAVSKEYRYRIVCGDVLPPHEHPFAILKRAPLDLRSMREAAKRLEGRHDFAAFAAVGSSARTTVRTIHASEWIEREGTLIYRVAADGFLYKMVRRIVGTLLEVGRGRRPASDSDALVSAAPAVRAGPVVLARGLHLWKVTYGPDHESAG